MKNAYPPGLISRKLIRNGTRRVSKSRPRSAEKWVASSTIWLRFRIRANCSPAVARFWNRFAECRLFIIGGRWKSGETVEGYHCACYQMRESSP